MRNLYISLHVMRNLYLNLHVVRNLYILLHVINLPPYVHLNVRCFCKSPPPTIGRSFNRDPRVKIFPHQHFLHRLAFPGHNFISTSLLLQFQIYIFVIPFSRVHKMSRVGAKTSRFLTQLRGDASGLHSDDPSLCHVMGWPSYIFTGNVPGPGVVYMVLELSIPHCLKFICSLACCAKS